MYIHGATLQLGIDFYPTENVQHDQRKRSFNLNYSTEKREKGGSDARDA